MPRKNTLRGARNNHHQWAGSDRGFTIVELLIVIVVIGILAAISIVTYTGIQKRAGTTAYTATVDGLEKNFRIADTFGQIPKPEDTIEDTADGLAYVLAATLMGALGVPIAVGQCVGDVNDYPATDGFAAGECYRTESTVNGEVESIFVDEELSQTLKDAGMELPRNLPVVRRTLSAGDVSVKINARGIYMFILSTGAYIFWNPPESSSCGRGVNVGGIAQDALEAAGGIDAAVEQVKQDPEKLAEAIELYGEDWESSYRQEFSTFFGSDRTGSCILVIER
jgi:prepilin-type N-terminal cleavage/methylation domain-containing protein